MTADLTVVDENSTTPNHSQFDIVDVGLATAAQKNFEDLVEALLDHELDYQAGKKKKSAWRKLARAFNISDEKVCSEIIRDEDHQIISAYFEVKAILPNGRYSVGVGDCSIFDKITHKDAEMPSNFELRKRFTNAEHDVIATAHTRAKSRAISDLVGAGEVSAEELDDTPRKASRRPANQKKNNKTSESEPKPNTNNGNGRRRRRAAEVVEAEVIETKGEEVREETSDSTNSFDEIAENNSAVKTAINRISEAEEDVTVAAIVEELYTLYDIGDITIDEYYAAKEALGVD